ncbi:hypothetical protein L4X63_04650 [Geomonas sp. Red32]|uniref:hypothetical protein n=1 Tax=Geomonas sp. Red32 TaxID=2912856 RepID=UPI00202CBA6D|nr:hypothetical protein [Geomonas sp. Red32]MCM0080876.1 hypothetical protein [Geomonas sp. Red32]
MNKALIAAVALAVGVLSVGAVSASAANSCCDTGNCPQATAAPQFNKDTANLRSELKAKDLELRGLYAQDTVDPHQVSALEGQIKELKGQIRQAAGKYNMPSCCQG